MALQPSTKLIELVRQKAALEAYDSFYAFRQHISRRPNGGVTLKRGWFVKELCDELQQFYNELVSGNKPTLVIEAPPQHGKSVAVIEFIAWLWGKHPELRTIYTSFSDRLGVRANLRLRRIFASQAFKDVFPNFSLNGSTNTTLLESGVEDGAFRNTTVLGSITGETLDLGVVDDPMKGREQANSEVFRNKTWDWFTDDFFTRFDEKAGLLIILTRWHIDDPVGRLIEIDTTVKRLQFRAIADCDEKHRKAGEALFPEHKSLEFLLKRKKILGSANFEALYQQNPIIPDGNIYKLSWFKKCSIIPDYPMRCVHSWDTAYKADQHNDPSALTVWKVRDETNEAFLKEAYAERLEYPDLKRKILAYAERDNPDAILIEDKASGQSLIQELKLHTRLPVIAIKPEGDKLTRAVASSAMVEAGRISIPENAEWFAQYINQLLSFPNGRHDDMVDSTSQFLNWWKLQDKDQMFKALLKDTYRL